MGLRDEILEQPDAVARVLQDGAEIAHRVAGAIRAHDPAFVLIAARGTSDNAALYAQYLFTVRHRLPVALATPSTLSLYGASPRLERALVIGVSQSGQSPDIVGVVADARTQGALTIAITNEPASPLAEAASDVIPLLAGEERAVAATKTYTTELAAFAMLSVALGPDAAARDAIARVPAAMREALTADRAAQAAAEARASADRCVVLGRGYEYATAREWALKLQELAAVLAVPFSAADFEHGPVALVEPGFPVLAVAPAGPAWAAQRALLGRLRDEYGGNLLIVTDDPDAEALGDVLAMPRPPADWLGPLVSIVPGQLFAYHLTRAKGRDTESPRGISKVTFTR